MDDPFYAACAPRPPGLVPLRTSLVTANLAREVRWHTQAGMVSFVMAMDWRGTVPARPRLVAWTWWTS